jgi:hypothetical protein
MVAIIDATQDVRHELHRLAEAGIRSIIRYDCRLPGGRWKEASNGEIGAILAAGMHVGIVNEGIGNAAGAFSDESGYLDAKYSRQRAHGRAQPAGSAIYFAIDFDPSFSELHSHVVPYFHGVKRAMAESADLPALKVGAYCSGMAAEVLKQADLIDYVWITCSGGFSGSRAYTAANREDLWQYACERNLYGLDVDYNLSPTGYWGQWPEPQPDAPAVAIADVAGAWPNTWGPQIGKASWYADFSNANGWPVHASDMTAASRTLPFGTKVRATRLDTHAQQSVIVTITDRGPYAGGRIIDFRPAAAEALGMKDAGVVPVRLEAV